MKQKLKAEQPLKQNLMFNSLKRYILGFFSGVTVLRESDADGNIYLSDANFAQNPQNATKWNSLGIDLIINVTSNDPTSVQIQELYNLLGIDYFYAPINDDNQPIPANYLSNILNEVMKENAKRGRPANILIHCSAGINRSALVAAAILWYTTNVYDCPWSSSRQLIEYMRQRQLADRNIMLLINPHFYEYLMVSLN